MSAYPSLCRAKDGGDVDQGSYPSRDPEGLQTVRIFEEAYDQVKLDHDGARTLNNRSDELKVRLSELIAGMSVPVRSISAVDPEVGYAPEIIAVILVIGTLAGVPAGVLSWHP